jgi:hypothetical protein
MNNKADRVVTASLLFTGKQTAVRFWTCGGSQTVTLVLLPKVRWTSGAAVRIKKAEEKEYGDCCRCSRGKRLSAY